MNARPSRSWRAVFPLGMFLAVAALHFVWLAIFPERDPAQVRWATIEAPIGSALSRYIETESYWLVLSYALALAFAATAFRRSREDTACAGRTLAIGSVTVSGFLAIAGCYVLGCCGSPMVAVYVSLFGAHFLPLTKPLVAVFTVCSIVVASWWMHRTNAGAAVTGACANDCVRDETPHAASRTSG